MKIKLLILAFAIFGQTHAQDCKWQQDKTDKFSGMRYLKTSGISVPGDQKFGDTKRFARIWLELKDEVVQVHLKYTQDKIYSDNQINGPVLSVRLKEAGMITMYSDADFTSDISAAGTEIQCFFELSLGDLRKFRGDNIVGFRLEMNATEFDFIPPAKKVVKFDEIFNCMVIAMD